MMKCELCKEREGTESIFDKHGDLRLLCLVCSDRIALETMRPIEH